MAEHPLFIPIDSKIRSLCYMTVGDAPTEEILHEICVAARQFATIYIMNMNPWSTAAHQSAQPPTHRGCRGGFGAPISRGGGYLTASHAGFVGVTGRGNAQGKKKDRANQFSWLDFLLLGFCRAYLDCHCYRSLPVCRSPLSSLGVIAWHRPALVSFPPRGCSVFFATCGSDR